MSCHVRIHHWSHVEGAGLQGIDTMNEIPGSSPMNGFSYPPFTNGFATRVLRKLRRKL